MSISAICRLCTLLPHLQLLLGAELDALVQSDAWQSICVLLELPDYKVCSMVDARLLHDCPMLNSLVMYFYLKVRNFSVVFLPQSPSFYNHVNI